MKEQRLGRPIRSSQPAVQTYSTRVVVQGKNKPNKGAPVPASCKTYSKKGFGAATMTVPQLVDFIKQKAPKPVFEKFTRLQKKTRPELCELLGQFEEGYRLLYPPNKPKSPPPKTPEANNLEGMLNMAERIQRGQQKKNLKKIVEGYNKPFTFASSPSSPYSNAGSTPGTPNFVNYNNGENNESRMRERNIYLRRLAEKRVVRDPLNSKLSAANMKRLGVFALKGSKKSPKKQPARRNNKLIGTMKFNGKNMRVPTNTTRGLKISTSPRVNKATMRAMKNKAQKAKNQLANILKSFEKVPPVQRPAMMRTRMRFIKKMLNDPNFENKLISKEKYRATVMQRLGLNSPPKARSPTRASFTMVRGSSNDPLRALTQNARLAGMMKKNNSKTMTKKEEQELKNRIVQSMMIARNRQATYRNIANYKIEGKSCMSYKKSQLVKAARLVTKGKIKNLDTLTKEELCKLIKENRSKK